MRLRHLSASPTPNPEANTLNLGNYSWADEAVPNGNRWNARALTAQRRPGEGCRTDMPRGDGRYTENRCETSSVKKQLFASELSCDDVEIRDRRQKQVGSQVPDDWHTDIYYHIHCMNPLLPMLLSNEEMTTAVTGAKASGPVEQTRTQPCKKKVKGACRYYGRVC
jgi:hypothetical protein